jgi:Tfp pilus assembly protein PilO
MTLKRQWILVTALIGTAILIAGYMFVVRPQYNKSDSLRKQATAVHEQTNQLRTRLATLQSQQKELPQRNAELAQLLVKIPAGDDLADLTRQLQAAAQNIPQPPDAGRATSNNGHVDLSVLTPGTPTDLAVSATGSSSSSSTSSSSSSSATAGSSTSGGVAVMKQIPLTLTVSGSYFNIEAFLDRLETMKRAILVDGFSVNYQGSAEDPLSPNSGELALTINARAFMTTAPLTTSSAQ